MARTSKKKMKVISSVMFILLVTKVLGFIKIRIIAGLFGVSRELDVFWAAFAVPDTIFNILVAGGFNAGILPVLSDAYVEKGKSALADLFRTVFLWFSVGMVFLSILMYVLSPTIANLMAGSTFFNTALGVNSAVSPDDIALLSGLMRVMLLSPIFLGLSNLFSVLLQLKRRFAQMTIAPLFYNLGIIVFSLLFYRLGLGIWGMAWAIVSGSFLHFISQIIAVYVSKDKLLDSPTNIRLLLVPSQSTLNWLKEIIFLSIPRSLSLLIEQINVIINTLISFTLSAGALSAYKFAYSLYLFPIHILSSSISVVALPDFAESNSRDNRALFRRQFNKSLQHVLYLILPVVVIVLVLRLPIVRLAYGTGQFDWWATVITSWCLFFFSLAMIGQSVSGLALRAFYALHDTVTPLIVGGVVMIVNIVTGYYMTNFLSHYLDWRPLVRSVLHDIKYVGGGLNGLFSVISENGSNLVIWFTTRDGSDFAVGGLALALGVAFLAEGALYLLILHRKYKLVDYRQSLLKLSIAVVTTIFSYILYRLFDFSLDTSRTLEVIVLSSVVSISTLMIYHVLSLIFAVEEALSLTEYAVSYVKKLVPKIS